MKTAVSLLRVIAILPFLAFAAAASAAGTGPFEVNAYGSFTHMMHSGDTSPNVSLAGFDGQRGVYGVGAMQGLRGEVLIWDGRVLISRGHATDGATSAVNDSDQATLLATANVKHWREIAIPADMTQPQFEGFVKEQGRKAGLPADKPFPFIVKGPVLNYAWHVVAGPMAAGAAMHKASNPAHARLREFMGVRFDQALLLGFYSGPDMEGAITHPGEQFHVHLADADLRSSGHVDRYGVGRAATLLLPVP